MKQKGVLSCKGNEKTCDDATYCKNSHPMKKIFISSKSLKEGFCVEAD
jgi:hypothetical protein